MRDRDREKEGEEGIGGEPHQSTLTRFKQVENTNYVVELGKQSWMTLVGIQGSDIVDANRTLVLGLVWQLMRMNITKTLSKLADGGGKLISDMEMVKWANGQAAKKGGHAIRSFKGPSLATGIFFLDVLEGMRPGSVDPNLIVHVHVDGEYEDRKANAKLAISIARKLNALIFLVPEDIIDIRPRLVRTFITYMRFDARC